MKSEVLFYRADLFDTLLYDPCGERRKKATTGTNTARNGPFHYNQIDRTKTLPTFFREKIIEDLPEFNTTELSFEDVMINRAREILNIGLPIDLYWSGGIDSTAMLIAFILKATHEELMNIKILMCERSFSVPRENKVNEVYPLLTDARHNSFNENPRFFKEHILGKSLNYKVLTDVDGMRCPFDNTLRLNTHIALWGGMNSLPTWIPNAEDRWEPRNENQKLLSESCPFPIKKKRDYFYWFELTQKQQGFLFIYGYHVDWTQNPLQNLIPFQNGPMFETWGMQNYEKTVPATRNLARIPLRQFIYDYTKDEEYFHNILQVGSARYSQNGLPPAIIDSDFNRIDVEEDEKIQNLKR